MIYHQGGRKQYHLKLSRTGSLVCLVGYTQELKAENTEVTGTYKQIDLGIVFSNLGASMLL